MIEFTDADHFTEKWTNTEAGKDTIFEMHFHREPVRDLLRGSHRSMLASPLPCGFATNDSGADNDRHQAEVALLVSCSEPDRFRGGEGAAASVMPAINVENDSTFLPLEMGLCATRTMILPPVARRT